MAIASKRHGRDTLRSLLVLGVLMAMSGGMANAGEVSEGQILQALTPKKPLTRSLSMTPPTVTLSSVAPRVCCSRLFISMRSLIASVRRM